MVQLKILVFAMDGQGHVNAVVGLADILRKAGHQIVFTLAKGWESLILKHGFEFIPLELDEEPNATKDEAPNAGSLTFIQQQLKSMRKTPMQALEEDDADTMKSYMGFAEEMQKFDQPLVKVMDQVKPDIMLVDFLIKLPCLMKTKIPWVQLSSGCPIALYKDACPPAGSGFPTDSPKEQWNRFRELQQKCFKPMRDLLNEILMSKGLETLAETEHLFGLESPYMNIYNYPEALDYTDMAPRPRKWFRMDAVIREPDEKTLFTIPLNLVDKPGKLILFSLGSMGSVDLDLMRNVIRVLAKSPHRFIISKGPFHEQIELGDNMWGDRYLNQIAILPHVDLVITHGGNNTLTESLYFGKPIIVMPLLFDQFDNAQRVDEKKLGIRLDTYRFKDEELLDAIEKLLKDEELHKRLEKTSQDIRNTRTRDEVCSLIEKTAVTKKTPPEID